MSADTRDAAGAAASRDSETLSPLPGEAGVPSVAAHRASGAGRGRLLAFSALVLAMTGASVWAYQNFAPKAASAKVPNPRMADKPAAASAETRRLELGTPAPLGNAPLGAGSAPSGPIPAAQPPGTAAADPLGIQARASAAPPAAMPQPPAAAPLHAVPLAPHIPPEDAPVLLVSTRTAAAPYGMPTAGRTTSGAPSMGPGPMGGANANMPGDSLLATARNLDGYQQQLQGLLETLSRTTQLATNQSAPDAAPAPTPGHPYAVTPQGIIPTGAPQNGLFGGQLPASHTPRASAGTVGNRSLLLPKGTAFTCALKTRVVSATSGLVGCQVQRHVYSDDGRVLLIERGSHLDGEYRIAQVRQGMVRIPVLWTRIRTPNGITVDLESPATGALGESGIDGQVDNRWPERIGAAMLLSLIDDSVKLVIQNQTNDRNGDTIVLPSTAANASKLAEKVLDSTINIPPLITSPQGSIVGIYVARDVDFSSVYELRVSPAR